MTNISEKPKLNKRSLYYLITLCTAFIFLLVYSKVIGSDNRYYNLIRTLEGGSVLLIILTSSAFKVACIRVSKWGDEKIFKYGEKAGEKVSNLFPDEKRKKTVEWIVYCLVVITCGAALFAAWIFFAIKIL